MDRKNVMNRINIIILLALFFTACYNQRPALEIYTYEEAQIISGAEDPLWENTGRGLHASFGSTDIRYPKDQVPMEIVVKDMELSAWRGERVNMQLVLWTVSDLKQVECVWQPLVNESGDSIITDYINTRFIRYVIADEYKNGCGLRSNDVETAHLEPDVLDNLSAMDMSGKTVRPVWICIDVPQTAKPGIYSSSVKIYSKMNSPQELRIKLNVQDRTIPSIVNREFHLNLKQNPLVIALWHDVKPWSDEHFEAMKPYMQLLAKSGQKSVSCLLYEGVSEDVTFNTPTSMIKWSKTSEGRWKFDFSILERWIQFMESMGIDKHINLYSILPLNKQLFYRNEINGSNTLVSLQEDSEARRKILKAYFSNLSQFLSEQGWMDKTSIVIEDKNQENLADFIYWMRKYEPEFQITLITKRYRPELLDSVQHLGLSAQYITAESMIEMKKTDDTKTSLTIDCMLERPNLFTFSSPSEAAWFGWFAAAHRLDGLYYSGFNDWTADPLIDGRTSHAPSGANSLIYPDCRSSVRFEKLMEGIQDYEKLNILEKDLNTMQLEELHKLQSRFTVHRMDDNEAAIVVRKGREIINRLSDL
nr:glycoside hydrolase domain-containing protein [uncultured Carboxylicivirga sp.]